MASDAGVIDLDAIRRTLTPRYEEAHRAYHGLAHIEALLGWLERFRQQVRDPLAVTLAIWFHDAVYDTRQHDNEAQSALLAGDVLARAGADSALIDSVQRKVRATQRHEWTDGDPDTALFLDLDLSILAAGETTYDGYARQVAAEYDWVPPEAYREGRAKVLRAFLDRPNIYFTAGLRQAWEESARANLSRELAALGMIGA